MSENDASLIASLTAKIEKEITEWVLVLYQWGIEAPMYVNHSRGSHKLFQNYTCQFLEDFMCCIYIMFNILFLIIFLSRFILFLDTISGQWHLLGRQSIKLHSQVMDLGRVVNQEAEGDVILFCWPVGIGWISNVDL